MKSKRSQEGYLLVDHTESPGIPDWMARWAGYDTRYTGAGKKLESATLTCHGCGGRQILNPKRDRPREWCSIHDAYLCDVCALRRKLSGICLPLEAHIANLAKGAR